MLSSSFIFYLLIVFSFKCTVLFISALPFSITNLNYVNKQYPGLYSSSDVAVITATFDEDPYVDWSCNPANVTSAFIVPCCSATTTTSCFTPSSSNHQCLDTTPQTWNLTSDASVTFEFLIGNPSSCDAAIFIAKSLAGDPDIAVSFSSTVSTPDLFNADYVSENVGTDQMIFCCSDIFALNPYWNGVIYVSVIAYTATQFVAQVIPKASRLNAVDFYQIGMHNFFVSASVMTMSLLSTSSNICDV
jgi:hypothetical protein